MGEDGDQAPPAPLVPGVKATRLQSIYAQALGGTLKKLSWANFAGCYPTIAKRADGVLRKLQEQMANQLQGRCEVCLTPFCRDYERRMFCVCAREKLTLLFLMGDTEGV